MRDQYGALCVSTQSPAYSIIKAALALATEAAGKGRIPPAVDNMSWQRINSRIGNKRIGSATHHEVYDVSEDGRRALICCRSVEGDKYGIKTTGKDYFIVSRHGKGVRVTVANKAICAKASKQAGSELGLALAIVEGKARLSVGLSEKRHGYKLVTTDDNGSPVSVWDGSPWTLGKARTESATDDHTGGFYYYRTLEQCLAAAAKNATFGPARSHRRLVAIEVEASGNEYTFGDKLCATRIRPIQIICSTL